MSLSPYLDPSPIFLSPPLRLSSIVLVLYPLSSSFLPPFLSTPLFFCPLLFPIPLQVASAKISQGTGTACVSWGATFSLPLPRDLGPKTGTDSVQISSSCSSYFVLSCVVLSCLTLFYLYVLLGRFFYVNCLSCPRIGSADTHSSYNTQGH
jgi:hypothetical protein